MISFSRCPRVGWVYSSMYVNQTCVVGDMNQRLQKYFTAIIHSVKHLNYWDLLKCLDLYTLFISTEVWMTFHSPGLYGSRTIQPWVSAAVVEWGVHDSHCPWMIVPYTSVVLQPMSVNCCRCPSSQYLWTTSVLGHSVRMIVVTVLSAVPTQSHINSLRNL